MQVALEAGDSGQFDVLVDDEVIARRDLSLLKVMLGGGWPEAKDVIAAIKARLPG